MIFSGKSIQCTSLDAGITQLCFDAQGEHVNKFDQRTLAELTEVVAALRADASIQGLLITSGKDAFMVGADITEFLGHFAKPEAELTEWIMGTHRLFCALEDLPFPSVTAINGVCVGGGLEFSMSTGFRVLAANARIGLPETKLGIFPGWGGTVRLSRLAGADNAIEWIASGELNSAEAALGIGVADAVVAPGREREAALDLLGQAIAGSLDWKARRQHKLDPLKLNETERMMVFDSAKSFVGAKAGPNYPAPLAGIVAMEKGATLGRDEALAIEAADFARIAKTPSAFNLVANFLADQFVGRTAKQVAKAGAKVQLSAVLGAGIMGGGIAYQSASKGTPIIMKDIQEKALALGLAEADKLLVKAVERGKMSADKMAQTLNRIRPTLNYGDFKDVDLVVEAVVENEQVKASVLADLERQVKDDAILASNTSTISITRLAEGLQRPENFCGMHFFNPVPRMPLVEVIRGAKSSDRAVATTVGYALAMGKTPIVVNDCAGFLVNRVLFPYFGGFERLVADGVPFQRIDQVMEAFGWPMGPAFLLDVVGIDTAVHADRVMAQAFPDRMAPEGRTAMEALFDQKRFGQKNGLGFYAYVADRKGVPRKQADPAAQAILAPLVRRDLNDAITDQDIIDRMMLPMILECSRCLEDGIVATPVDVDLALIYGLGFPPFRGGALRYADAVGLRALCERAQAFRHLGKLYHPTAQMIQLAEAGSTFHEARS